MFVIEVSVWPENEFFLFRAPDRSKAINSDYIFL